MTRAFDVAVVGLGITGASAARAIAARGARVVGLDRYFPPHPHGSSHGRTRIIREAYFEGESYVPLVRRARAGWLALQESTSGTLLRRTGALTIGAPDGSLVRDTLASARRHRLRFETFGEEEIPARFPGIQPPAGTIGVLERQGGILLAEPCLEATLRDAVRHGAAFRFGERATGWRPEGAGVRVRTRSGPVQAGRIVLAAGAWMSELFDPGPAFPMSVTREVVHWFRPVRNASRYLADALPVALVEYEPDRLAYTVPDIGEGLKVGLHHAGRPADPDAVDRTVAREEVRRMRSILARWLPGAAGRLIRSETCLYTSTPDRHFIVGPLARDPRVVVAGACSGHGFKFGPALGEVIADLALEGRSDVDLSLFAPGRFGP